MTETKFQRCSFSGSSLPSFFSQSSQNLIPQQKYCVLKSFWDRSEGAILTWYSALKNSPPWFSFHFPLPGAQELLWLANLVIICAQSPCSAGGLPCMILRYLVVSNFSRNRDLYLVVHLWLLLLLLLWQLLPDSASCKIWVGYRRSKIALSYSDQSARVRLGEGISWLTAPIHISDKFICDLIGNRHSARSF